MGVGPVPDDPARLVLVESQVKERLDEVARLRDPLGDDVGHLPPHGVGRAAVVPGRVPEERDDVARRRQPDPQDRRVLRRVDQLVKVRGIEAPLEGNPGRVGRAREGGRAAVGEGPSLGGHRGDGPVLGGAPGQGGPGRVQGGRGVGRGQRERPVAGRHIAEPGEDRAGDGLAVPGLRHRDADGFGARPSADVALPAAGQDDVAPVEEEPVAGVAPDVEGGEEQPVAPVGHRVDEDAARPGEVHRPPQRERRDVLHQAPRVAGRQVEVGNDCVAGVPRVEFAEGAPGDPLVSPGGAEGFPPVGGGLLRVDDNPRHPRLGRGGDEQAEAHHRKGDAPSAPSRVRVHGRSIKAPAAPRRARGRAGVNVRPGSRRGLACQPLLTGTVGARTR